MRAGGAALILLALAACGWLPSGAMEGEVGRPVPPIGPRLVVDVENRRNTEVMMSVEFEGANANGGAEGPIDACTGMPFVAEVVGSFRVLVDGDEVLRGLVPPAMGADDAGVVRLVVLPDGAVQATGPGWGDDLPRDAPRGIPGCG